jgi:hypothetical protein
LSPFLYKKHVTAPANVRRILEMDRLRKVSSGNWIGDINKAIGEPVQYFRTQVITGFKEDPRH